MRDENGHVTKTSFLILYSLSIIFFLLQTLRVQILSVKIHADVKCLRGSIACRQPFQMTPSATVSAPKIARRASTFIVVRKSPLIGDHGIAVIGDSIARSIIRARVRTGKTAISSRAFQNL